MRLKRDSLSKERLAGLGMKVVAACLIIVIGLFAIGGVSKEVDAACCDMSIISLNLPAMGEMMQKMVVNSLVDRMKSMLMQKLGLEFLQGNFFFQALLSGQLNLQNLTNLTPNINTALDKIASQQMAQVQNMMSTQAFATSLNSSLQGTVEKSLASVLESKGITASAQDIKTFSGQYQEYLSSTAAVNAYAGQVADFNGSMTSQLKNIPAINDKVLNFGALADISQSVTKNSRESANVKAFGQEAAGIHKNAVEVVDAIQGYGLKQAVGDTFVPNNAAHLTARLEKREFCDSVSGECVTLSQSEIRSITDAASVAANKQTERNLSSVKNALVDDIDKKYGQLTGEVTKEVGGRASIVSNLFNEKDIVGYFTAQDRSKDLQRQVANQPADAWKSLVSKPAAVDINNARDVTALIKGSGTPTAAGNEAMNRYVAAQRALAAAGATAQHLKGFNLSSVDSGASDQAWKDYARLRYYSMLLRNEKMKLTAAAGKSAAVLHEAGTIAEFGSK